MTILMRSLLLGCFIISGPPLGALAQTSRLRIIHTNDMHARFDQVRHMTNTYHRHNDLERCQAPMSYSI